jgi:hypothetical protein
MFGTPPPPHPLTGTVYIVVLLAGAVLLTGAVMARRWRGRASLWVRRGAALLALGVPITFEVFTLSEVHPLEGVARLLTLWPLVALDAVFFLVWVWRGRQPKS